MGASLLFTLIEKTSKEIAGVSSVAAAMSAMESRSGPMIPVGWAGAIWV
jgi:hypothetical protein